MAVEFVLLVKQKKFPLAPEENEELQAVQVCKTQFSVYKKLTSDVRAPEPDERVIFVATESGEVEEAGQLSSEQKLISYSLELVSRFSHPGDLVLDLFAKPFSTSVAFLTLPRHLVLLVAKPIRKAFVWRRKPW